LAQSLRELWAFRGTILAFAERDVRLKYRQAVLGVAWAVIQPLAFMAIFTIMLGKLANVPGGGVPYAAFSLSALIAWSYLQNSISFGANALLADGALMRKVYFPREVPVLGAILSAGLDLAIGLVLFVVLGPFLGARPSLAWLLAPLLGVLLAMLAAGVALTLAAFNVYYRDFRYALPFALQLWLFASPVAYPLEVVPEPWRGLYVAVNPAAGVLDGFRRVLALGELPDPGLLAVSLAGTLVVLLVSYRVFKRRERHFADVV
jgi:ABC-type polysaccharide/polyol phosphate export permease